MFSTTTLECGKEFPDFPDDFLSVAGVFGIEIDESRDVLPQLAAHALKSWIKPEAIALAHDTQVAQAQHDVLKEMGLVSAVLPTKNYYDHLLLDGGTKTVFDWRLDYLKKLLAEGIDVPNITVFSGQRLRFPYDDHAGLLEDRAAALLDDSSVSKWGKNWLENELSKDPNGSQWNRPFATEHEIAMLALLDCFGKELDHVGTRFREDTTSIHPSIPPATVLYEDFTIQDRQVQVMNARAIIRGFVREMLPVEEARPTGQSCFHEWVESTNPQDGASVLLVTHNPNIYRSWLDILVGAQMVGRGDLQIEGAGAPIEPHRSNAYILRALGRLFVTFYNYTYDHYSPVMTH